MTLRYEGLPGTATYVRIGNVDRQTALWLDTRLHTTSQSADCAKCSALSRKAHCTNCGTVKLRHCEQQYVCSHSHLLSYSFSEGCGEPDIGYNIPLFLGIYCAMICSTLSRNLCILLLGLEIPRKRFYIIALIVQLTFYRQRNWSRNS